MQKEIRGAEILGIGSCTPPKVLTNADIEKIVDTTDEWIFTRTGISQRHVVEPGIAVSDLSIEASKQALEMAGIPAEKIGLIVCATITGDMPFPSTACLIQAGIGASNAAAFDLQAGCAGWVYALATAAQFVENGTYDYVLAVGGDALSTIADWTDRATCVLFGDGAGAVVLGPSKQGEGVIGIHLGADGTGGHLLKVDAGGSRMPTTEDTVKERLHFIKMDGREVYKFAVRMMGEASLKVLADCGLTPDDIDVFVPHQANVRIIDASVHRLKLPPEKVFINVQNYGNTSAASIPLALHEAYNQGKIKKDDLVVVVGFGAGLTWASAVIKWTLPTK